jgi:hypothetical protein
LTFLLPLPFFTLLCLSLYLSVPLLSLSLSLYLSLSLATSSLILTSPSPFLTSPHSLFHSTILVQRIFRGYLGRRAATHAKEMKTILQQLTPHCIRLQKIFRGKRSRRQNNYIHEVIRDLYDHRSREAEGALLVRLQSYGRYYLAQKKYYAWKEMILRQRVDTHHAAIMIQNLIRCGLSKKILTKLVIQKQHVDDMNTRAAIRIQVFYRACKGKYNSKLTRQELVMIQKKRKIAIDLIIRIVRGYYGRQKANHRRIEQVLKYCAARNIQRIYRGRRVINWKDMRLNIIASFILDRQYIERIDRTKNARKRYQEYLKEIQKDSASDDDDDDDEDGLCLVMNINGIHTTNKSSNINSQTLWIKNYYPDDGRSGGGGAGGGKASTGLGNHYWIHAETGEISYDEPPDYLAIPKSLIGIRIKVLWCVQNEWYEGQVTKYHLRKRRYRVDYDDGDHEWIDIEQEKDRVQVMVSYDDEQNHITSSSWVMFALWKPPLLEHEYWKKDQKLMKEKLKEEAYRDARQWRVITTDLTNDDEWNQQMMIDQGGGGGGGKSKSGIMFLSSHSGMIRTGTSDALDWVIQDDGYGFPCFFNLQSGEIVFEDPRFEPDLSSDLENQRNYVMQELRYAVYFCRDALDRYENAAYLKNPQKIHHQLHKIASSNKPKLLTAFLLRAKALYKPVSVVDRPVDENIVKELEYASWLAERMAVLVAQAEEYRSETENARKEILGKVIKTGKEVLVYDPMIVRG